MIVGGGFLSFNGRCSCYPVLQRLIKYGIPEFTEYGGVRVHYDSADWLTADLAIPNPCGPFKVLWSGKRT